MIREWEHFYWTAFLDLSGDRSVGMGGAGPIMWASVDAYARRHRIDGDAFDRLLTIIKALDAEYLKPPPEPPKNG